MIQVQKCPVCQSENFSPFIQTEAQMHPSKEQFNFDQCADCALVFLNPRLKPEGLTDYYRNWYLPYRGASAWGKYAPLVKRSQFNLDERRVKVVQQHHTINKDTLIVDVGCGKPTFLKQCLQQFKCKVLGLDFSNEGWINTTENFSDLNLQTWKVSDLPTHIEVDVITMWHYLEHDYDPLHSLIELRKRAKPNATLIIEVPNFESESRKKFGKHWAGWHTPRHLSLFSPNNIQLLLKQSDWKTQQLYTYGTLDPYLLYWMSKMEQKDIAWNKNMETEFVNFVRGMLAFTPKKWKEKKEALGIMMVVANAK